MRTFLAALLASSLLVGCVATRDATKESAFAPFIGSTVVVPMEAVVLDVSSKKYPGLAPLQLAVPCGSNGDGCLSAPIFARIPAGTVLRILSATYVLERGPGSVSEVYGVGLLEISGLGDRKVQFLWRVGDSAPSWPWQHVGPNNSFKPKPLRGSA